jgi:hypothetical protein
VQRCGRPFGVVIVNRLGRQAGPPVILVVLVVAGQRQHTRGLAPGHLAQVTPRKGHTHPDCPAIGDLRCRQGHDLTPNLPLPHYLRVTNWGRLDVKPFGCPRGQNHATEVRPLHALDRSGFALA